MKNSDSSTGQTISIFPTTIFVTEFKPSVDLVNFFNSLQINKRFHENKNNENEVRKRYGYHTQDIRILKNKECEELRKHILENALYYSNSILGYDCVGLSDTLSWLSIKAPGEEHIPHTHPNSFISGVYYYEEVSQETPLVFKKSKNFVNTFEFIPPFKLENAKDIYTATNEAYLLPQKGMVVFFPAHLEHYVPKNNTMGHRGGLAFNLMPVESLGDEMHLTAFKYKDTINQF